MQEISSKSSEKRERAGEEMEGGEDEDEMELKAAGMDTMASHNFSSQDTRRSSNRTEGSDLGRIAKAKQAVIRTSDPKYKMNADKARFPLRIVWTPLPMLTQFMPSIGHTGIGDSRGVTHDFAGPYYVSIDDLAFGETHKYVVLDLEGVTEQAYDEAIRKAD